MIDKRLFDWYGIDIDKNLKLDLVCGRPFNTILINKDGSCYACECSAWLPQSIGNLYRHSMSQILTSNLRKELQTSVKDKTYRYCNNDQCAYLIQNRLDNTEPDKSDLFHIRVGIDDSCNLSCPSCRKENKFISRGKIFSMKNILIDKICDYVRERKSNRFLMHVGADGDPFASLVYRRLFFRTKYLHNLRYSVLTNGLLIKKTSDKFSHVFCNLDKIGISIDATNPVTYEKIRKGAKFKKLLENLEHLAKIKMFDIEFHFVVQRDNFMEMEEFINFAKKFRADRVYFNKITDWNVMTDFNKHAVWQSSHPQNPQYKKIIEKIKKEYDKSFVILGNLQTT